MRTKNFLTTIAITLLYAFAMAGCGLVYDDEDDCVEAEPTTYTVRFRYDMNLKFADAFAHEVHSVQLYVLNDQDQLVWKGAENDHATLAAEGYEMTIPAEKITPGNTYKLLAWCGSKNLDECSCYDISSSDRSADRFACDLVYDVPEEIAVHDSIDNLYHGLVEDVLFPDAPGKQQVATIPLTKDTNRFVIVLQHLSGTAMQSDDFSFRIEANNQRLSEENEIIVNREAQAIDTDDGLEYNVEYRPWAIGAASADMNGNISLSNGTPVATATGATSSNGVLNVVVAELTVNRLVIEDDPRLIVTNNSTGKVVFDVPVKDYALMVKGRENASMPDQEYLDRQDEYNMTFFLDERDQWFNAYIYINSWMVVLQNSSL
jgi:uncharacterized protein YneR